jgi:hypothetical protein
MATTDDATEAGEQPRSRDEIRASDYVSFDFRVLESALPAVVFLVANSLGPPQLAIVLSFVTSAAVFVRHRGSGTIQLLAAFSFAIVSVSAVVGLVFGSTKAFVAQNAVTDFVIAAAYAVSVVARRPLIGLIARELVPSIRDVIGVSHSVFVQLSIVAAVLNAAEGVARLFLLEALSANQYVIVSRVAFIPVMVGFSLLCYWRVSKVAIRIWPADKPPPPLVRSRDMASRGGRAYAPEAAGEPGEGR